SVEGDPVGEPRAGAVDSGDRSLRLQLPVSRRRLRHGGQPHGGPTGARARPLPVLDRQGPFGPRDDVQRRPRRRHPQGRPDPEVLRARRARRWVGADLLSVHAAELMAATRPPMTGRQKAEAVVMYPLDWLEERSGLVGAIKYFLFRKVPGDVNWFQTLGSATLTAFLVQAITGVILAMYYKPDPTRDPITGNPVAWASIHHITNDLTLGWIVRGMHPWVALL